MKYWKESESMGCTQGPKKAVEEDLTKDSILNQLAYIKRGHMPDWNYETRCGQSLPNEYYPLHLAMNAAIQAIGMMDDSFFAKLNEEIREGERKVYG